MKEIHVYRFLQTHDIREGVTLRRLRCICLSLCTSQPIYLVLYSISNMWQLRRRGHKHRGWGWIIYVEYSATRKRHFHLSTNKVKHRVAVDAEMLARLVTTLSYFLHFQTQKGPCTDCDSSLAFPCLKVRLRGQNDTRTTRGGIGDGLSPSFIAGGRKQRFVLSSNFIHRMGPPCLPFSKDIFPKFGVLWWLWNLVHSGGENVVDCGLVTCGFEANWSFGLKPMDERKMVICSSKFIHHLDHLPPPPWRPFHLPLPKRFVKGLGDWSFVVLM